MSTEDQMSVEDRVRTATRAGASLIRDVRPLGAPAPVRLRRRPGPAPRRWANWGVPLAAAAAVAAIALTLVAVRQPAAPSPVASRPATAAPATVPRYYAAVVYDAQIGRYGLLTMGDDLTGTVIGTVSPPPGLVFTVVHGTSDDRTFVVQAAADTVPASPPFSWYLLRITPGNAHPYQLTKLPVKLPGSRTFALAYALSPDGRELAVESVPGNSGASPGITLAIYSVSTGAQLRAWNTRTPITDQLAVRTLSWLDGGRQLVFSATAGPAYHLQLRALDVTGTGTDLMARSRVLLTTDDPGMSHCGSLQITPDGGTAICATEAGLAGAPAGNAGCANGALRFTAVALPGGPSGKLTWVLYQYPGACHDGMTFTLWTDASASTVIGVTRQASKDVKEANQVGVITGGHFRPLKIAKNVPPDLYVDLAF